ncbi:TPA: hypothetical protein MD608_004856 [Citrobacter freundii]|uniref:hypothetical protein n=1 Tax=Citrobacter freundii TaxID=546 RepID=UPI0011147E0A|nr:hypothetical protein [Citrobacter freundii]HAT2742219.1 hypothetical protein [Citrobacter freundii]HAT2805481.1 hypothetical protein [Citrobacter freundii]HAT2837885.1 hypothetical protein [Citrobacter freundii]HAU4518234.1 hypothetical protein [Citrobacter freundii]
MPQDLLRPPSTTVTRHGICSRLRWSEGFTNGAASTNTGINNGNVDTAGNGTVMWFIWTSGPFGP